MKRIWPFSLNLLLFAGMAFTAPFMVLYYQGLGLSGVEIGLLTGLTPFITLIGAPLWTGLADALHRHRLFLSLALAASAASVFLFPFLKSFWPVMVLAVIYSWFFAPISAIADSATMSMLGDEKAQYGRIRIGGTIGFGVAATLAGLLVQSYGLRLAFWGGSALFLGCLVVSQKLTHGSSSAGAGIRKEAGRLLSNRVWILFLVLAFAGGLSVAAMNNYLFSYLKQLGARESTMGYALSLATISELPVFFFGDRLLRFFKPYGLLIIALLLSALRLLLLAAAGSPAFVLILQLFNGVCFPAMWMAGVSLANQNAPPGMGATAQGLFGAAVFGIGGGVGGFAGGLLLERVGGRGLFFVFGLAVLGLVALVAPFGWRAIKAGEALRPT